MAGPGAARGGGYLAQRVARVPTPALFHVAGSALRGYTFELADFLDSLFAGQFYAGKELRLYLALHGYYAPGTVPTQTFGLVLRLYDPARADGNQSDAPFFDVSKPCPPTCYRCVAPYVHPRRLPRAARHNGLVYRPTPRGGRARGRLLPPPGPALRYLTGLAWWLLAMKAAARLLFLRHAPNLFLKPVSAAGELVLLAQVYRQVLRPGPFARGLPWLVGGFLLYVLADDWLFPVIHRFKPGPVIAEGLLVVLFVSQYFRQLLGELTVQRLDREPLFWVSVGLIFYFARTVQISLFSNFLAHYSRQLNMNVWALHALLYALMTTCFAAALALGRRAPQQPTNWAV